jgi:hypothetical protein
MRVISKDGDEVNILCLPDEELALGEYLAIEDSSSKERKLIVQVYDLSYFDAPGLIEDLVREEMVKSTLNGSEEGFTDLPAITAMMRDLKIAKCKVRKVLDSRSVLSTWLPSRASSAINRISCDKLLELGKDNGIWLGYSSDNSYFYANIDGIDGCLNVITGRKGSGKSHLAKIILSSLVSLGAYCFIFDLNDEYVGLRQIKSEVGKRFLILRPGEKMKFSLSYLGFRTFASILKNVLDLPSQSLRELSRVWKSLDKEGYLSLDNLIEVIRRLRINEHVREALLSRLEVVQESGIISNNGIKIEDLINSNKNGLGVIITLGKEDSVTRRMVVELILSKLSELVYLEVIPPIFIFAEEAHLYLRETYWDDIITRMRHIGMFTTLITNQPDAITNHIYRQVDNLFIFNFTNSSDIEHLAKVCSLDSESIKAIVKTLSIGSCLVIGKVSKDLPIVLKVRSTDFPALGNTKHFIVKTCFRQKFNTRLVIG